MNHLPAQGAQPPTTTPPNHHYPLPPRPVAPPTQPPHSHMPPHHALLFDLIDSEKAYASDLFVVIKRIAGAYSPENLPPSHLDHHFRLIEFIFRPHKSFISSLIQLDPPPDGFSYSSLVQLLASWIGDLAPVYHRYCAPNGWAGAGRWHLDHSVTSNQALLSTLISLPWPSSLPPPPAEIFPGCLYQPQDLLITDSLGHPHPSLTVYFALPFARLVYYRRLCHKITHLLQPNGSDHRCIADASNQLSALLDLGYHQWTVEPSRVRTNPEVDHLQSSQQPSVSYNQQPSSSHPASRPDSFASSKLGFHAHPHSSLPSTFPAASRTSRPASLKKVELSDPPSHPVSQPQPSPHDVRASTGTSFSAGAPSSSIASVNDEVFDRHSPSTPLSISSGLSEQLLKRQQPLSHPQHLVEISSGVFVEQAVLNLQLQVDTSRCQDIFTMTPKHCRLHLAPSTLAFSRTLRLALDASFKFRPQSLPDTEIETTSGSLILITDLIMFCEHIPPDQIGTSSHSLWLLYPPLAGKHLSVVSSPVDPNQLEVVIMGRESIRVIVKDPADRDRCVQSLVDAVHFGLYQTCQAAPVVPRPGSQQLQTHFSSQPPSSVSGASSHASASFPRRPESGMSRSNPDTPTTPASDQPRPFSSAHSEGSGRLTSPTSRNTPWGLEHPPEQSMSTNLVSSPVVSPSEPRHSQQIPSRPSPRQPLRPVDDAHFQSHIPVLTSGSQNMKPATISDMGQARSAASSESRGRPAGRGRGPSLPPTVKPHPVLRKAPSAHALGAHVPRDRPAAPPLPVPGPASFASNAPLEIGRFSGGGVGSRGSDGMLTPVGTSVMPRAASAEPLERAGDRQFRPPSSAVTSRNRNYSGNYHVGPRNSGYDPMGRDYDDSESIPDSPKEDVVTESVLAATMRTKVFLKQSHSQWKSLGPAKLHVFIQNPGNLKQLVVGDDKGKTIISTMVITDAVERVGRTGVAVDLSDKGVRTGIVYMLQMKNDKSANGLFEQLLAGSDRRPR